MLIFDPATTWEKIQNAEHSIGRVLTFYLLPIMLLAFAVEGALILRFGVQRGQFVERVVKLSQDLVLRYEIAQLVLGLLVCVVGAWLFQKTGQSFHRRHTYAECFTTLGYSLGPYFLLRILDGWPAINTWICWAIGALLAISALYRGIPRLMRPDPSNALGLYLMCSILLLALTGVAHLLAAFVLEEKILASGLRLTF